MTTDDTKHERWTKTMPLSLMIVLTVVAALVLTGVIIGIRTAELADSPNVKLTVDLGGVKSTASATVVTLTSQSDGTAYTFAVTGNVTKEGSVPAGDYDVSVIPAINPNGDTYELWAGTANVSVLGTTISISSPAISKDDTGVSYYDHVRDKLETAETSAADDDTRTLVKAAIDMTTALIA